jgi:hypothetical protein
MSAIHFRQTSTATPEQYIAALTDFGPGRSKVFGNSADGYLQVQFRGCAPRRRHGRLGRCLGALGLRLVRAGSGRGQTSASNFWGGNSGDTYT